jgi:hypothetical protein
MTTKKSFITPTPGQNDDALTEDRERGDPLQVVLHILGVHLDGILDQNGAELTRRVVA